ncbi:hypothetical protein J5X84_42920 [Streptosporangiaceae bacterium NEAU-GS5]|nr:hypothetical protein [Streptosporangiaceae bacterium NEAU-GS5]
MRDVIATPHQSLLVGGLAEVGFYKQSVPYVPGSTVRGALAATWIRDHGVPGRDNPRRDEFVELFEGEVLYSPLMQDGTAVIPLTALRCKYPKDDACQAWSADAAVDGPSLTCPQCRGGVETGKGEVTGVASRRVLRTQLGDDGCAVDGHLYARQELSHERTYHGRIIGTHPWLEEDKEIWLGGRTTTSGRTTFRTVPADGTPVGPSPRADGALVVQVTAPALIVDEIGRPSLDPATEILRILDGPTRAVTRTWTRPQRVSGWHAASGLPKPTEIAMSMGSVTVVQLAEEPDPGRLALLARRGIGLRRSEGFGTVEVNPPAWRHVVPQETSAESAETKKPVLAEVHDLGLLDREDRLRWLIDRGRKVLVESEQRRTRMINEFFRERVALYFDDQQADAVRRLFESDRLPGALTLLEQALQKLQAERQ